jgi:hypothetical protein
MPLDSASARLMFFDQNFDDSDFDDSALSSGISAL